MAFHGQLSTVADKLRSFQGADEGYQEDGILTLDRNRHHEAEKERSAPTVAGALPGTTAGRVRVNACYFVSAESVGLLAYASAAFSLVTICGSRR
ncbi:hypothetical protein RCH21_002289 [Arthrobacter sp. PL16]|nr:hypothetical protein [Arthrobacter sp. PL16]